MQAGAPMEQVRQVFVILTAIWDEESRDEGVRFLSVDPGDMDTPLHAAAIPDADPSTLRSPVDSAMDVLERMLAVMSSDSASTGEVQT